MYDIIIGRDKEDSARYGDVGTIFLGKHYVKMGQTTSLSNKIYMDVTKSHVTFVCGKRGSGKCLHGDTLITLADGSQVPIKNLEKNSEKVLSLNTKFFSKIFKIGTECFLPLYELDFISSKNCSS